MQICYGTKTLLMVQRVDDILEFIEEYTIDVEGVGHVCRFVFASSYNNLSSCRIVFAS